MEENRRILCAKIDQVQGNIWLIYCFCIFHQQQKCKPYYIYLMIISEIQSEIGHCSCDSTKLKAPADFSHHAILCMTLSLRIELQAPVIGLIWGEGYFLYIPGLFLKSRYRMGIFFCGHKISNIYFWQWRPDLVILLKIYCWHHVLWLWRFYVPWFVRCFKVSVWKKI